jgi:hypothetical protein
MSRRLPIALLLLVVVAIGARIALPSLAEIALERVLSGLLAARLEIRDVDLDLREAEVVLADATLHARESGAELAGARRIALDADWGALLSGRLEAQRLAVDAPRLLLTRDAEGRLNWAGVPARSGRRAEEPAAAFRVAVRRVDVGAGELRFEDALDEGLPSVALVIAAFALERVVLERPEAGAGLRWALGSATASDWSFGVVLEGDRTIDFTVDATAGPGDAEGALPIHLELASPRGARLRLDGTVRADPVAAELSAAWEALPSRPIAALAPLLGIRVEEGRSGGELEISLTLADVPERGLVARGSVSHEDLLLSLEEDVTGRLAVARVSGELAELRVPIPGDAGGPPPPVLLHWKHIGVESPALDVTLPPPGSQADGETPPPDAGEAEGRHAVERAGEPEGRHAVERAGEPEGRHAVERAGEPEPGVQLVFDRIELGDGELRVRDTAPDGLPDLRLLIGALALDGAELGWSGPDGPPHWALASVEAGDWQLEVEPAEGEKLEAVIRARAGPVARDAATPVELSIRREDGVRIEVAGELRPDPPEAELRGRWAELPSRTIWPFVTLDNARLERGVSEGEFELSFTLADVTARGLVVRGAATHRDLALGLDDESRARIEVSRASAQLEELRIPIPLEPVDPPPPVLVHFARVELDDPSLDAVLVGGAEEGSEAAAPPRVEVRVAALRIRRGRARLQVPALGPDHEQALSPVELSAEGLRWPEPAFDRLELAVGGLGAEPLRIEGSWTPGRADVDLHATRVPLSPWNPLWKRYKYSVSRGTVSLHSPFRLRGEAYEAPTEIVLHRLEARSEGEGFRKTFGMPLAVAIPLLRDPSGNIRLRVNARGTLAGGSEIDLVDTAGRALREAILNALASAVASPLDLAGALLRRAGDLFFLGIGEAAFAPGDAELGIEAKLALGTAAQIAAGSGDARLELVPRIVTSDLEALGVVDRGDDVLDTIVAVGRTLFGGGRALDAERRERVDELVQLRLDAVASHLRDEAKLPASRVALGTWDGKVRDGTPRVLLRIQVRTR